MSDQIRALLAHFDRVCNDMTLGELIVVHSRVDTLLNELLDLQPISDTLDLRSCHIRAEKHLDFLPRSSSFMEVE